MNLSMIWGPNWIENDNDKLKFIFDHCYDKRIDDRGPSHGLLSNDYLVWKAFDSGKLFKAHSENISDQNYRRVIDNDYILNIVSVYNNVDL